MPSMLGWSTSRSHCSPTNRCGSDKATTPPELFPTWRTGLAANRTHQVVAIARRATELPDCVDAFCRGELAIDQMATLANRAPWWTDNEICDLASSSPSANFAAPSPSTRSPTSPPPTMATVPQTVDPVERDGEPAGRMVDRCDIHRGRPGRVGAAARYDSPIGFMAPVTSSRRSVPVSA